MENENVIDYMAVLADMDAKKAALEAAIAGVRQMLGQSQSSVSSAMSVGGPTPTSVVIRADEFFQMSIGDTTIKYLNMVRKPQSTQEIATALESGGMTHTSKNWYQTVSGSLLRRESADGEIMRVKRGMWGLSTWYPGKARKLKKDNGIEDTSEKDKAES